MQALRGLLSIGQVRCLSTAVPDTSSIANSIFKTLNLRSGQALVQNEGDSDIGKAIIQLAKERGITTINIIADKPGSSQLIEALKELGGDIVVTEGYTRTWYMKRLVAEVKPIAGLNFTDDSQATAVGKAVTEENGRFDEAYNYYNEMAVKGLLLEPRTKILVKAMEIKAKERERKTGVCDTKKKKKRKLDKSSSRVETKIA